MAEMKKSANDFVFDGMIGEGSFSTVPSIDQINRSVDYKITLLQLSLFVILFSETIKFETIFVINSSVVSIVR